MGELFGHPRGKDARFRAQQLAYDAMEAGSPERALKLANKAVETHNGCVDALLIIAQASSQDLDELIQHLHMVIEIGVRDLGEDFFEENTGHFWGLLETRPYMRARSTLAEVLLEAGRVDEAVELYEGSLRLNPNDNQGIRCPLLGCYLEADDLDGARRLFDEYEDEGSAMFLWSRVLERVLSEDEGGARKALADARKTNKHVEPYLTGAKQKPKRMPDYYGFGDENEAKVCAGAIGGAWKKHPKAVRWLKQAG